MHPQDCYYSKEHEWLKLERDGTALVGITHYAQDQLGDVVFLALPPVGAHLQQFQKLGEIESVKAVSDLFTPASGQVLEVNQQALDKPELVNKEPYVRGWLLRLRLDDPGEMKRLLSAQAYEKLLAGMGVPHTP